MEKREEEHVASVVNGATQQYLDGADEAGGGRNDDEEEIRFSEEDAAAIMKLVIDRCSESSKSSDEIIIQSASLGLYMTLSGLKQQFIDLIQKQGGRCRVDRGAQILGVSMDQIRKAMMEIPGQSNEATIPRIIPIKSPVQVGKDEPVVVEFVMEPYLDQAISWIQQQLKESSEQGFIPVSGAINFLPHATASCFVDNTFSVWLDLLQDRLTNCGIEIREKENGSRVFITRDFWQSFCVQVFETLSKETTKISLVPFCQQRSWDHSWTMEILTHPNENGFPLPGEVQTSGDLYIPDCYKEWQHKVVRESYLFHGFVTVKGLSAKADLSPTQVIRQIEQEFGKDAIFITENKAVIVSRQRIVDPWLALVEEANVNKLWCEFAVPLELLSACGETLLFRQQLLEPFLGSEKSRSAAQAGMVCASSSGNVLYVSRSMLDTLTKIYLPPIVAKFAKERTPLLLPNNRSKLDDITHADLSELLEEDSIVIPELKNFVEMVQAHYPNLGDDDGGDEGPIGGNVTDPDQSLLADFCRRAFVENEQVRIMTVEAIQKEASLLQRQRSGGAFHVASGVTSEELSPPDEILIPFEDPACFSAACFQIQNYITFYEYAVKHEMESTGVLHEEIRLRSCADFTRRVHQYCLSQYQDLPAFTFIFRNSDDVNRRLPVYCSAIDIASSSFGSRIELTCSPDPDSGKERDPMAVIRDFFPGSLGNALNQQYDLCSLPGKSLEEFLTHAEEHTLTICGLPFKKLDKKSEKSYLAERRQLLRDRLKQTLKPHRVLELTIMILYQTIKSICVAGSQLTGPVLRLLVRERKIPKPIGECLVALSAQLMESNKPPDRLLVEAVRGCGLCKDISKHSISS